MHHFSQLQFDASLLMRTLRDRVALLVGQKDIEFLEKRPHRERYLLTTRSYRLILTCLLSIAVLISAMPYNPWATLVWVVAYWLYRRYYKQVIEYTSERWNLKSPSLNLIRALVLIVAATLFLAQLYNTPDYSRAVGQYDTLWLLYVPAIFLVARVGNLRHIAIIYAACVVALILVPYVTLGEMSWTFVSNVIAKVTWLTTLTFTLVILIQIVREQNGNIELLRKMQDLINKASESDEKMLLQAAARLIEQNFTYKHVIIFLVEENQTLVCRAGSSHDGRRLSQIGYSLTFKQGIVGRAASTKATQNVPDKNACDYYVQHSDACKETRSEMAVPIIANEQLLGVLDLQTPIINGFSAADQQLLLCLAQQIGQAIAMMRFRTTYQCLAETIVALPAPSASPREHGECIETVVEATRDALRADLVVLYEVDRHTRDLRIATLLGQLHGAEHLATSLIDPSDPLHSFLRASQKAYFHDDLPTNPSSDLQLDALFIEREAITGYAVLKLTTGTTVHGLLVCLYRTPHLFGSHEKAVHLSFANLAARILGAAQAPADQTQIHQSAHNWCGHRRQSIQSRLQPSAALPDSLVLPRATPRQPVPATLLDQFANITQYVEERYGVRCYIACDQQSLTLAAGLQQTLLGFVHMALRQAIDLRAATFITGHCDVSRSTVALTIEDNGKKGKQPCNTESSSDRLQQSVASAGGTCRVMNTPFCTRVVMRLPLFIT